MYIKKISLKNFRNYNNLDISLQPGINVFLGDNGSGKTNILEAIYWISMLKSFRISEDAVMISKGKDQTNINLEISDRSLDKIYGLEYQNTKRRKIITENNNKMKRMSMVIGKVPVVLFSPENIQVVKGDPSLRRKLIDDMLSQIDNTYYYFLNKYLKQVSHRNYLLKGIREGKISKNSLEIWDQQVMENGIKIILARLKAIEGLNIILKQKLCAENKQVFLEYNSKRFNDLSEEGLKKEYAEFFSSSREEEIARGITLAGPHRDDISIFYNGSSAKLYGSEGQQRITSILVKLAEGIYIREKKDSYPVVMLDDFSSELDDFNRRFIGSTFKLFKQILITTTNTVNLKGFEPAAEFKIDNGEIQKTG